MLKSHFLLNFGLLSGVKVPAVQERFKEKLSVITNPLSKRPEKKEGWEGRGEGD